MRAYLTLEPFSPEIPSGTNVPKNTIRKYCRVVCQNIICKLCQRIFQTLPLFFIYSPNKKESLRIFQVTASELGIGDTQISKISSCVSPPSPGHLLLPHPASIISPLQPPGPLFYSENTPDILRLSHGCSTSQRLLSHIPVWLT